MDQGTAMADKKHAARFPGGGGLQTHGSGSRQLDWVYANVAGVTVERRVHPLLSVPWRGRYQVRTAPHDCCRRAVICAICARQLIHRCEHKPDKPENVSQTEAPEDCSLEVLMHEEQVRILSFN